MLETLTDVLRLFDLTDSGNDAFKGLQPDTPNHHIVGGQIAAQALMAASCTVRARTPHSLHVPSSGVVTLESPSSSTSADCTTVAPSRPAK